MNRELFFTPEFQMDFNWGDFKLRVGSVRPHNKKQISDGLRDMSPESIRNRFLGSKREFSEQELQYLTQLDGWNHYAIGIEEREGSNRGVAVVRLVRSSHDENEAEVAITIIDSYQRKGLGSFLINLSMLAAMERKIEKLSFTFLPQNDVIVKLVNKIALSIPGESNKDYVQLFVDVKKLKLDEIKARLRPSLPTIDTFQIKT